MLEPKGGAPEDAGDSARWRRFAWLASPVRLEDRERIAYEVMRLMQWPLMAALMLALGAVWFTVGFSQPTRFVPTLLLLASVCVALPVASRRSSLAAVRVFLVGALVSSTFAVLTHSVHAPGYLINVMILAAVIPLFGARAGLVAAGWMILSGAGWFVLRHLGWASDIVYPNSAMLFSILCAIFIFSIGMFSVPSYLLATALRDLEQRRRESARAESAERELELAFGAVFERTVALAALVGLDGTVVRMNRTGESFFSAAPGQFVGKKLWDLPWHEDCDREALKRALETPSELAQRAEVFVAQRVGRRLTLQLSFTTVRDETESLRYWVVEGSDVTQLLDTQRDLSNARRLEALGQLAGGVAHDFNNMLMALKGAFESLTEVRASEREREEAADTMAQAIGRATDVTRKLLAFGRRDRFETRVFDLNELVKEASSLLRRTLGAPIELVLALHEQPVLVEGDESAIEHALLNLVVNARDAMLSGGRLTIRTRAEVLGESDVSALQLNARPGKFVSLSVEDTGIGMAEQVKARAFEPFFTTKLAGEGSGLGLAAVHGTMASHHGGVSVESRANAGTVVRLFFPAVEAKALTPRPHSSDQAVQRLRGKVLVVDDEPLLLRVVKRHLFEIGVEAVTAGDGPSAIALLDQGFAFDCVITDFVMPKMSGMALVRRIRERKPDLPIIVMTGYPLGGNSGVESPLAELVCLRKPFDREDLAKVLMPILEADSTPT